MRKIIFKFSVIFFNYIHNFQKNRHSKRMQKLKQEFLSTSFSSKKISTSHDATLIISEKYNKEKEERQKEIEAIIKSCLNKDNGKEELLNYIKKSETKIYHLKNPDKLLKQIGEKEGFIFPQNGLKALYLRLFLDKDFSFKSKEIFVLKEKKDISLYSLIYQFYNWYCFKSGLNAFDMKAQNNFKHVFEICETQAINALSFKDAYALKEAISQDIEAINFVINFVKNNKMSKKCLEKIKNKEAVNI